MFLFRCELLLSNKDLNKKMSEIIRDSRTMCANLFLRQTGKQQNDVNFAVLISNSLTFTKSTFLLCFSSQRRICVAGCDTCFIWLIGFWRTKLKFLPYIFLDFLSQMYYHIDFLRRVGEEISTVKYNTATLIVEL